MLPQGWNASGTSRATTAKLADCAESCGPGNLHLINGLFDCMRSHVPALEIASHIPSSEIDALADTLAAPIVHAYRSKEHIE